MLYVRLIGGYRTDVLYSIRKENGWEGVKMERIMTNEKKSGIIGSEKIPVHTERRLDIKAEVLRMAQQLTEKECCEVLQELKERGIL